jgi:hypothetical protein
MEKSHYRHRLLPHRRCLQHRLPTRSIHTQQQVQVVEAQVVEAQVVEAQVVEAQVVEAQVVEAQVVEARRQ